MPDKSSINRSKLGNMVLQNGTDGSKGLGISHYKQENTEKTSERVKLKKITNTHTHTHTSYPIHTFHQKFH